MLGRLLPWLLVAILLAPALSTGAAGAGPALSAPAGSPIVITPVAPLPGSTVYTETPNITATYTDSAGTIAPSDVDIQVDGIDVTGLDQTTITSTEVNYAVPAVLALKPGNHTVQITITAGPQSAQYSWGFNVSSGAPPATPQLSISGSAVLIDVALGVVVFMAAFTSYYVYLRKKKRFTFHKYFATHPVQKEYLTLYIPMVAAFITVMAGLSYVFTTPNLPWYSTDSVFVIGLFVGLTPYGADARREKSRIKAYESAFAQFLFEMADAMRGGIDPAKAIIELSKTETDIMAKPLRIAADGLQIGRSFDTVLRAMVVPMKSPLIRRYAALIADAATVGGETSMVMYRAARDMDDFIKIERTRAAQLTLPIGVVYISFGVLVAVLFALMYIAPSLGSLTNVFSIPGGFGGNAGTPTAAPPPQAPTLSFSAFRERIMELALITSLGNGALIGAFTDGKPKYGIPHMLGMAAGVLVVFIVFFTLY